MVLRVVLGLVGVAAVALVLLWVVGARLPVQHVAAVRVQVAGEPSEVHAVLRDVRRAPEWRTGLKQVEVLDSAAGVLSWREATSFGPLELAMIEDSGSRVVNRVRDPDGQFGGRWIFEFEAAGDAATLVTITEEGEVYSPLFRGISRYVFGHYGNLERYAHDLAKRLGEDARVERVAQR